eukprot:CAMPEP_0181372984 /NCGR_PEP_ID=MMETSP1106-20121128/15091_1 /TAXON_ID=81844 /ORGANISM="Mantoniella antarctica, Strain SL-175" /LENGTH=177 /DNA_ID=CAMNT_0023490561 /DNA_START=335 /DNA_END=868 /DNA_ORIENTATION=-
MALTHYVIGGGAFQEAIVPSSKRTTSEDDVISRVTAIPEMWSLIAKHGVGEEPVSSLLSLSWAVRLMVVCKAARVGVKEGLSTIKTFNCSEQLLDTRFCSIYARASSKPRPSLPAELLQRLSGLKFLWLARFKFVNERASGYRRPELSDGTVSSREQSNERTYRVRAAQLAKEVGPE